MARLVASRPAPEVSSSTAVVRPCALDTEKVVPRTPTWASGVRMPKAAGLRRTISPLTTRTRPLFRPSSKRLCVGVKTKSLMSTRLSGATATVLSS